MNLQNQFSRLQRFYPDIAVAFIGDYCAQSANPDSDYYYGKGSFKWYMFSLEPYLDHNQLWDAFYSIVTDYIALAKSPEDIQYNILKFPSAHKHKDLLKQNEAPALEQLETFKAGDLLMAYDPHNEISTKSAIKATGADVIYHYDGEQKRGRIAVNPKGKFLKKDIPALLDAISENEGGWKLAKHGYSISNPGLENGTPTSLTPDDIVDILKGL